MIKQPFAGNRVYFKLGADLLVEGVEYNAVETNKSAPKAGQTLDFDRLNPRLPQN